MNIIKKITRYEMVRRFAIGEVYSEFFFSDSESIKQDTFRFLTSGDHDLEELGIQRHWETRGHFVNSLPDDTEWSLAKLDLSEDEFARLRTINCEYWITYTNESLRLIDAAIFLKANPKYDLRITKIISPCKQGHFET